MKKNLNTLNIIILKHPWTLLVLSIIYVFMLRGAIILCDIDPRTLYDQMNYPYSKFTFTDDDGNIITLYDGKTRIDVIWADIEIHVKPYISPYKYPEIPPNVETSCFSSNNEIVKDITPVTSPLQEIEIPKEVNPDIAFVKSLENLPLGEKALQINAHLFNKINAIIGEEDGVTQSRLKEIVTNIMLEDMTRELWGRSSSIEVAMKPDSLGMIMMNVNTQALMLADQEPSTKLIMTHMNAHIALITNASVKGCDNLTLINNPLLYNSVYRSVVLQTTSQ